MRKFKAYGAAALLAVSAVAGGVSYAQDATATLPPVDSLPSVQMAQRTWLGVSVNDEGDGVTITKVSANSPAETAALQEGDVITAVNGTAVDTADELRAIIEAAASSDVVTLTVQRDSAELSVDVTLGTRDMGGMMGGMFSNPVQIAEAALGAQLETTDAGYQVVSVDEDSALDLQAGDVITAVNSEAIDSFDWTTLMVPGSDSTITLTVQRDGADVSVEGTLSLMGGRGGFPGGRPDGNGQPGNPPGGSGQPDGNGQRGNPPGGSGQPNGNGQPGGVPPADGQPPTGGFV